MKVFFDKLLYDNGLINEKGIFTKDGLFAAAIKLKILNDEASLFKIN